MFVDRFGWYSNRVEKYMEYLRFGNGGTPVIVFPTSGGDHHEFSDRGMVEPLTWKIDQGLIQLFCIDTNNWEGWYNNEIHPRQRVEKYAKFEEFLIHEFIPHLWTITGKTNLILFGASFGGYHAINFALKHPELIDKAISLSGSFTIKGLLDGYYDDLCYFNNPVDYIPNLSDPWFIDMYNSHTELILVSSEQDVCLDRNIELANMLRSKNIRHQFIVWDGGHVHDWHTWKEMIGNYV